MTPKKKARTAVKARIRELIKSRGSKPAKDIVKKVNAVLSGWVNYFRVGNSSRAFSEVRDYTEMKIRTLLTRRKRRQKRSIGWRRWSNEYIYNVLGLYWNWKVHPLKNVEGYRWKCPPSDRFHNPFDEVCGVSCLRENLTSSSYGEGLETGRKPAPRQSFTRQIFFKCIKQHLRVKHFYGLSRQAVENQLLIALITYCLLVLVRFKRFLFCTPVFMNFFVRKLCREPRHRSKGRRKIDHDKIYQRNSKASYG